MAIWLTVIIHNALLCQVGVRLECALILCVSETVSVCVFICVFSSMYINCVYVGMHAEYSMPVVNVSRWRSQCSCLGCHVNNKIRSILEFNSFIFYILSIIGTDTALI